MTTNHGLLPRSFGETFCYNFAMDPKPSVRKLYTCHKFNCDFETFEPRNKCPKCGFPVYDEQTFRFLGILLCFLGGILTLGGSSLIIFVAPLLRANFGATILAYGLFAMLTLMGLATLTGGIKQALTGVKSSSFMTVFVILLVVTGLLIAVIRFLIAWYE